MHGGRAREKLAHTRSLARADPRRRRHTYTHSTISLSEVFGKVHAHMHACARTCKRHTRGRQERGGERESEERDEKEGGSA
jgi:hypothetical protein